MPPLSRLFIRASFIWLAIGLFLGFLQVLQMQGFLQALLGPLPVRLAPTVLHALVVGGILQLIYGVSYWMFPLTIKNRSRGNEKLGYVTFISLNSGLVLRLLTEPFMFSGLFASALYLFGAALQALSAFCYTILIWPRLRGPRGRA